MSCCLPALTLIWPDKPHFFLPILHLSTLFSNYANDFVTTWGCFHTAGEHNTPQSKAWFMLQRQLFAERSAAATTCSLDCCDHLYSPVAVTVWRGEAYFWWWNVNLMVRLVVYSLLSHHLDMSHKLALGLSSRGSQQAVATSYKLASSRSEGLWKESYKCTHFRSFWSASPWSSPCWYPKNLYMLSKQAAVTSVAMQSHMSGEVRGRCRILHRVGGVLLWCRLLAKTSAQSPCQIRF